MGWGEEWQAVPETSAAAGPGPAWSDTARPGQFSLPSGGGELIRHSASGPSRTVPGGQEATESARAENVTLGTHFMTRSLANSTKS